MVESKKRKFPQELFGRFSSKADFLRYFKEQMQLYVPPDHMVSYRFALTFGMFKINKDFLKTVFLNEKKLLKLSDVKFVQVPMYDELSVVTLWPLMQQDAEFMQYFPDKMPKGRMPDRDFFFNVLNTLQNPYCQALIKHAGEQRNTAQEGEQMDKAIEITDEWWDQLNSLPFISRKYNYTTNVCLDHKGRTIHLLKQGSKQSNAPKKRRKVQLMSTPAEFNAGQQQEEVKDKRGDAMMIDSSFKTVIPIIKSTTRKNPDNKM
jgi:hypothetical protein